MIYVIISILSILSVSECPLYQWPNQWNQYQYQCFPKTEQISKRAVTGLSHEPMREALWSFQSIVCRDVRTLYHVEKVSLRQLFQLVLIIPVWPESWNTTSATTSQSFPPKIWSACRLSWRLLLVRWRKEATRDCLPTLLLSIFFKFQSSMVCQLSTCALQT